MCTIPRKGRKQNMKTQTCKKCKYEMTEYQAINSYKGLCVCCYEVN